MATAKKEAALRSLMAERKSTACAINFLELCNHKRISDAMHIAASRLMEEGFGYAGEGDWVTAAFVYAMQQAFGTASFTEMFSVGYADNRIVLRHWGEGNFAMSRHKPKMCLSSLNDRHTAEFAIADFEFEPGFVSLVNLNCTGDGDGQMISIHGTITDDHLPNSSGPRAIFKPDREVRDLLTEYAYAGGSHHLALVSPDAPLLLEKISRLTGWHYKSL
jgi:L-arabinose isomerase